MVTEPPSLSQDSVFDVMSNSRRRALLYILRRQTEAASVTELAGRIAAIENDVPVSDVTKKERKRVYVSLYQTHVPKLESEELVEREDGKVRATGRARKIDRFLTTSCDRLRWYLPAIGVSVSGVLATALVATFGVYDRWVVNLLLGSFVLCLGLVALLQFASHHRRAVSLPNELEIS